MMTANSFKVDFSRCSPRKIASRLSRINPDNFDTEHSELEQEIEAEKLKAKIEFNEAKEEEEHKLQEETELTVEKAEVDLAITIGKLERKYEELRETGEYNAYQMKHLELKLKTLKKKLNATEEPIPDSPYI